MNFPTAKTPMGRRLAISGLAMAIVAGIGGAIWLTSSATPTSATVSQTASSLDSALNTESTSSTTDRERLKADLKAARALKGEARADALKEIRTAARAGKYGDKIEKHLGNRADRRAAFIALLPDALQADLKRLKDTPPGDARKALRKEIRKDALDGKYGEKVKKAAELLNWK